MKMCEEEGCDKKFYAKGMCHAHYMKKRRKENTRKCSLEGCERPYVSGGYCAAHYRRLQVHGDVGSPLVQRREGNRNCEHPGCDRPHRAAGYCEVHYQRNRKGLDMDAPVQERASHGHLTECLRSGCSLPPEKQGYCPAHYSRANTLKHSYGITYDDFDRMYEEQGGGCWICHDELPIDSPEIHVDHCHASGDVRGLLCRMCNLGLGAFRDRPDFLRVAAEYLGRP